LAPTIIGVILGPLAETQLGRALQLGHGELPVLVSTPMSLIVYALLVLLVVASIVAGLLARRQAARFRGPVAAQDQGLDSEEDAAHGEPGRAEPAARDGRRP